MAIENKMEGKKMELNKENMNLLLNAYNGSGNISIWSSNKKPYLTYGVEIKDLAGLFENTNNSMIRKFLNENYTTKDIGISINVSYDKMEASE